tara:strand:- start:1157 stop:1258 length:102 start_codon:yes stop_codon:yes gene_type:complete
MTLTEWKEEIDKELKEGRMDQEEYDRLLELILS